jgi:hypothetical protein
VVDDRHLFQFKAPQRDDETTEPSISFDNMLYTNDPEYVIGMSEILNDLWKQSLDVRETTSEHV